MPAKQRFKTKYAGVYYIKAKAGGSNSTEEVYYIMYRKNGRLIEEKAGRKFQDDMTPARAAGLRSDRIDGKQPTNEEKRKAEKAANRKKWTIDRLFKEYKKGRAKNKGLSVDTGRYEKHIKPVFGNREPKSIAPLDVDRLGIRLLKAKSPQTVKHVLNLLTWIINFGANKNLCEGISFKIKKPSVNNETTEDLAPTQLNMLLQAIEKDPNIQVGNLMKLALFTGMRRGELFKLKWKHVDFDRGFISIKDPKGGPDQKIPLNDAARNVLEFHPRTKSSFIFPGNNGRQRTDIHRQVNKIKKEAKLPEDFRPLHGLRHVYASMLASSGQVDMYTLQKLLTHKSSQMTQRYAHLRDEALKRASKTADNLFDEVAVKEQNEKVVKLGDQK